MIGLPLPPQLLPGQINGSKDVDSESKITVLLHRVHRLPAASAQESYKDNDMGITAEQLQVMGQGGPSGGPGSDGLGNMAAGDGSGGGGPATLFSKPCYLQWV